MTQLHPRAGTAPVMDGSQARPAEQYLGRGRETRARVQAQADPPAHPPDPATREHGAAGRQAEREHQGDDGKDDVGHDALASSSAYRYARAVPAESPACGANSAATLLAEALTP